MHEPWDLTDEERAVFAERSRASGKAKRAALAGELAPVHDVYEPRLDPNTLMPQRLANGLHALSLFAGGGGLDCGVHRAGWEHAASYDVLAASGETLRRAHPEWNVFAGEEGDVTRIDWRPYEGAVDLVHGGPPCQPFSSAGRQRGHLDPRDMWPQLVRTVREIRPRALIGENVTALHQQKFAAYRKEVILEPLAKAGYTVRMIELSAADFGVPQIRRRLFWVGFRDKATAKRWRPPAPTHTVAHLTGGRDGATDDEPGLFSATAGASALPRCMGAREALGLPDIGVDGLAPTIRSGLTGPRHTTSVLSSVSAQHLWARLGIWPNGVGPTREQARSFPAKSGHYRLSIPDVALLMGFPADWPIWGAVYMALGQLGNAVAPPVAYAVAASVADALLDG